MCVLSRRDGFIVRDGRNRRFSVARAKNAVFRSGGNAYLPGNELASLFYLTLVLPEPRLYHLLVRQRATSFVRSPRS